MDATGGDLPVSCELTLRVDGRLVQTAVCPPGAQVQFTELDLHRVYAVTARASHFQVTSALQPLDDEDVPARVLCLVTARHGEPVFPPFVSLDASLREVLERSRELDDKDALRRLAERTLAQRALEERTQPALRTMPVRVLEDFREGNRRWEMLSHEQKAGLLNLFAKLRSVFLSDRTTIWSQVRRVVRVEQDRIFAIVPRTLKGQVSGHPFKKADDSLHHPPPGFVRCGSVKTEERFGNLQLTFARLSEDATPTLMDADVDDAAGIEHGEQVVRNFFGGLARPLLRHVTSTLPQDKTHPHDIHQILLFHQKGDDSRMRAIREYRPCYVLRVRGGPAFYQLPRQNFDR